MVHSVQQLYPLQLVRYLRNPNMVFTRKGASQANSLDLKNFSFLACLQLNLSLLELDR